MNVRGLGLVAAGLSVLSVADAHGNLNLPIPRNNDAGYPVTTPPVNGSHGPSCLGDACGWFQAGCFIGCPQCSNASSGADVPSFPDTANCSEAEGLIAPTLPEEYRTYNLETKSPFGDWTASHPWRAPGHAPVGDACGLSGAYDVGPGVSGYPPLFPGSQIPERPDGEGVTHWPAGGVAEVGWSLWSNHGGGYTYRLCRKDAPSGPTEACFQASVLEWADDATTIRSPYGDFEDFTIPAKTVNVGTLPAGSAWRRNPIPACNCDKGYNCTRIRAKPEEGDGAEETDDRRHDPAYDAYEPLGSGGHPCETGYQFEPPWDEGFGYWGSGAHYSGDSLLFQLVDKLKVPEEKGEYLLSWRWDCENSPQVWGNCADIVVE